MIRMSKENILQAMLNRVCETKNVNIHLGKNYFVNTYMKMPAYFHCFVTTAEQLFDLNGYDPAEVRWEIDKFFRINKNIN